LKKRARKLRIRVNTNGHAKLLNQNRDVVAELKTAGVERVSVSLNAADKETYNEVCKPDIAGAFEAVLDFIKEAKQELEVEATAVTTPEIQVGNVEALAKKLGVKFRLRQCIPCFW
jgi:TatD family-associated radical SAM protein